MKKALLWFGGISLFLVVIFALSMTYAAYDKSKWNEVSSEHAKKIVNGFNEFNEEKFNNYWGGIKPGTPEQRQMMINWASKFGTLVKIDSVDVFSYNSFVSFTGGGVTHFYVYDVKATYTNGPVIFRLWFKINKDRLDVMNMNINQGT